MLPILALAGIDDIYEGTAGVGAYPGNGPDLAPYAAGFCPPGTHRWANGECRPYRQLPGYSRGYVSGPKYPLSGNWMGVDDCEAWDPTKPGYADCLKRQAEQTQSVGKTAFAAAAAMAILAGVIYFTRGKKDDHENSWDSAFTPNAFRRDLKRRRRFARKYHKAKRSMRNKRVGKFLSKMPSPRDLGRMSDSDADFLRGVWKKRGGKNFTSQYRSKRSSKRRRR
jgi:hypothetical protein